MMRQSNGEPITPVSAGAAGALAAALFVFSAGQPTLQETDELLAELAAMPRCPNVTEVVDLVLDVRSRLAKEGGAP